MGHSDNINKKKEIILLGSSGHALVAADVLRQLGYLIAGYLSKNIHIDNKLGVPYLGFEQNQEHIQKIEGYSLFPAIGDNTIRSNVMTALMKAGFDFPKAVSLRANVSDSCLISHGTLISNGACANAFSSFGKGVIINTGAIVEHECIIDDFAHLAPGAVLAGNVKIGKRSFIGANAVIKQSITIGNNVLIGAGSVVLHDIEDNCVFAGNPAKKIK